MNRRKPDLDESSDAGVRVTRRTVLRGSAAAMVSALLGRMAFASSSERPAAASEAFYDAWRALSARLETEPTLREEGYIGELEVLVARLAVDDMPRRQRVVFEQDGLKTGPAWFEGKLFIVELTLDPGAVIRPHNHPAHNVVTVGVAGACTYEHYEPQGDAPPQKPDTPHFTVRRTRAGILLPGRRSELTRTRDNIHTFRAGDEGATILDFTTTVGDPKLDFSELEIDMRPRGALGLLHEARWLGNPYR